LEPQDKEKTEQTIEVLNPATGERLGVVPSRDGEHARETVARARRAQPRWGRAPVARRAEVIRRFRDLLLDRADELSRLLSLENGKVLQESFQMEVFPLADLATYFAGRAERILAPRRIPLHLLKHRRSTIHHRPRGVVLVISPWNYPLSIPFGETIMGLLAGNAVIVKPAEQTPLIALRARELLLEAGLEPDLLQVVTAPGPVASEMIEIGVDYVNFTGSTEVGRRVSAACGRLLTPCTMELGGKDPAIVLPDADLDLTAGSLVWGAFANAGQTCASVERVYVHESVHDALVDRVVDRVRRLRVGDPLEDGIDMGPMTEPAQLAKVERQVEQAVARGAMVLTGGARLGGPGQFYPPTVLVDVDDGMEIAREETFGPTLPIMRYATVDEAVRRANRSVYGLDAYVYGRDRALTAQVARQLDAGTVMVNETLITHACPETPWGGVKQSGVGRVHSDDGLRELCAQVHVNDEAIRAPGWSPFWQPYSHGMYRALVGAARTLQHSRVAVRAGGAWSLLENAVRELRRRRAA